MMWSTALVCCRSRVSCVFSLRKSHRRRREFSSAAVATTNTFIPRSSRTLHAQPCSRNKHRTFSSRRGDDSSSWKNLYALPFTVSPESALESFRKWAVDEQGLNYLLRWQSVRIGAAYCPVWSFDLNIRFVRTDTNSRRSRYDWKPDMFSVYGNNPVVNLPGLSAYAGHSYRRSLIHPVHNTTLVFLGNEVVPFGRWMLRDMQVGDHRLSITPDPWNATRGRALSIVQDDLEAIARTAIQQEANADPDQVQVQTQMLSSRRVYMPTYFVDYQVFGMEYRAFISGCDEAANVSGVSHKIVNISDDDLHQASNLFSGAASAAQEGAKIVVRNRQLATAAVLVLQSFASFIARFLVRIPLIGLVGGIFVGFRKIIQPWMDNRSATAEWERQRENEAMMDDQHHGEGHGSDFVDSGAAERYYRSNRQRILRHLSGEQEHDHGSFDWYKEWEQWARQQWEHQQQQQTYGRQQQQQTYERQQQQRVHKQKSKPDYQWDFDPSDPYVATLYFSA